MKPNLLRAVYAALVTLLVMPVFGQQDVKNTSTSAAVSPFAASAASAGTTAGAARNINQKSVDRFAKQYRNVQDVKWYASDQVNVATFKDGNRRNTVVYLDNGKWLHTLINYDETELAGNIRALVNRNFRNYSIAWVTEVHEGDVISYFIKVENDRKIKELIVYDGEVTVYRELRKPAN